MIDINPKNYNLSDKVTLQEDSKNKIFIIIRRKSRIIMKDGEMILQIAERIREMDKGKKIGVLSIAPVCSKTKDYLKGKGISVQLLKNC